VNQFNCAVTTGCANCTQEVDFGRVNAARSPDDVFDRQLEDVVVNLAIADCITLDPAGRLVASRVAADATVTTNTIDSPLQNLAIYRQLMLTGFLGAEANPIEVPGDTLDTAARGLGVSSDKTGEVNMDLVAYTNSIMGLDDVPTILGKLCETYREEVQGTIQLVEKCYLNYGPEVSDIPPTPVTPPANYQYTRSDNFSTTEQSLPLPAYIPNDTSYGWFEYLAVFDDTVPSFQILQGPILDAVFTDTFDGGNIGGFAQASDDTRAVINFMHDWPMPDADVYATEVVCEASDEIAYDVSISDVSGLQVPQNIVDGSSDREFIVTVANAGPDPATVTLTVTAIPDAGGTVLANLDGDDPDAGFIPSPFVFPPTEITAGGSASFSALISVDIGQRTTINWTAVAAAPDDVNLSNNTATAVSNVKVTGSGGGGQGGPP